MLERRCVCNGKINSCIKIRENVTSRKVCETKTMNNYDINGYVCTINIQPS